MGLFGFLGKVAKAGLGIVTHGASDKLINGARAVLGAKPKRANMVPFEGTSTNQERAVLNKLGTLTPRVRVTESQEGWGFKSKRAFKRKKTRYTRPTAMPTRTTTRSATKPVKARSGRKVPSGGLDLRAMAQAFHAAGKPVPWRQWIKTMPIRKA